MTIITGLYPHQHLVTGNDPPKGTDRREMLKHVRRLPTLPKLLAEQGYVSFQSGKWWEGNFAEGGFTAGMTHGDPATRRPARRRGPEDRPARACSRSTTSSRPTRASRSSSGTPRCCRTAAQSAGAAAGEVSRQDRLAVRRQVLGHVRVVGRDVRRAARPSRPAGAGREHAGRLCDRQRLDSEPRTPTPYRPAEQALALRRRHPHADHAPLAGEAEAQRATSRRSSARSTLRRRFWRPAACRRRRRCAGSTCSTLPRARSPARDAVFGEIYEHDVVDIDRAEPNLLQRWCIAGDWKLIESADGKTARAVSPCSRSDGREEPGGRADRSESRS